MPDSNRTLRTHCTGRDQEQIVIGLDWIVSEDGRLFLLEVNRSKMEEYSDESSYSNFQHFFESMLDKRLQHQILGGLMPPSTSNPSEFEDFSLRHRRVVYKDSSTNMGEGVSIFEKPTKWVPDLVEAFIPPQTKRIKGKHYPFVLRNYITVFAEKDHVHWEDNEAFRKQSITPIEKADSPNEAYKLNTCTQLAEIAKATRAEIKVMREATWHVMNCIVEAGNEARWNPTRAFDHAIIHYYSGYRIPLKSDYPKHTSQINQLLAQKGIRTTWKFIVGNLSRAICASQIGSDLTLLVAKHYMKWIEEAGSSNYEVKRDCNGNILDTYKGAEEIKLQTFLPGCNLVIRGEKSDEELADLVIKNYHANRERDYFRFDG